VAVSMEPIGVGGGALAVGVSHAAGLGIPPAYPLSNSGTILLISLVGGPRRPNISLALAHAGGGKIVESRSRGTHSTKLLVERPPRDILLRYGAGR
jgi:hypothetical protein